MASIGIGTRASLVAVALGLSLCASPHVVGVAAATPADGESVPRIPSPGHTAPRGAHAVEGSRFEVFTDTSGAGLAGSAHHQIPRSAPSASVDAGARNMASSANSGTTPVESRSEAAIDHAVDGRRVEPVVSPPVTGPGVDGASSKLVGSDEHRPVEAGAGFSAQESNSQDFGGFARATVTAGSRVAATVSAPAGFGGIDTVEVYSPTAAPDSSTWSGMPAVVRLGGRALPPTTVNSLDTAVAGLFDAVTNLLSTLPANPISELLSGVLLLVRRGAFNQLPTASPTPYFTTVSGDLVGTLGVSDPESDPVTYSVIHAPSDGTVQIALNGTYTYTPGLNYTGDDVFTVRVHDPGFNLLDPFSSRSSEVTVHVGMSSPITGNVYAKGFDVLNLTPNPIKLTYLQASDRILVSPPVDGEAFKPGESVHFEILTKPADPTNTLATFTACISSTCNSETDPSWSVRFHTNPYFEYTPFLGWNVNITGDMTANSGYLYTLRDEKDRKGMFDFLVSEYALVEAPGTTRTLTSAENGATGLFAWLLTNQDSKKPIATLKMTAVRFDENPQSDPGYVRVISADNQGASTGIINRSVSQEFSTTKGSNWEIGGGIDWSPIKDILGLAVEGKYGQSESATQTRSFSTFVQADVPSHSANEILVAPPKLLVTGDATFTLGTGANARTYSFTDVQYYFPSQAAGAELAYEIETEPLQPKYTPTKGLNPDLIGTPIPNIGFNITDKNSELLDPTYSVGQKTQLTVTAFSGAGLGQTADKTRDPRTTYTSSNPLVAVIDAHGAVTATGPGKATIIARYDWTIPYGNGVSRSDYVLATMDVTVV